MPKFILKKAILKEGENLNVSTPFILTVIPKNIYVDDVPTTVYEVIYLDVEP